MLGYLYSIRDRLSLIGEYAPDPHDRITPGMRMKIKDVAMGLKLYGDTADATMGLLSRPVVTTEKVQVACHATQGSTLVANFNIQKLHILLAIFGGKGVIRNSFLIPHTSSEVRSLLVAIDYDRHDAIRGYVPIESSRPPTQDEIKERARQAYDYHRHLGMQHSLGITGRR